MGGSDDNDRIKWWQVQDSGRPPKATSLDGEPLMTSWLWDFF